MVKETDNKTTTGEFNTVRNVDNFNLINVEIAVAEGQLNENQVSKIMNQSRTGTAMRESLAKKQQKENSLRDYMRLMDQLEDLNNRINANLESLADTYGEDVIGGIASTFLTEAELEGLETDVEKMQALMEKMLDDDGNIKPEYAYIDARVIQVLEDWHDAQETANEINSEYENNNGNRTPEAQEMLDTYTSENSTIGEFVLVNSLENDQARSDAVETDMEENATERTQTGFDLGSLNS